MISALVYSQLSVCEDMIQFPQYCAVLFVWMSRLSVLGIFYCPTLIFVRNTQFYYLVYLNALLGLIAHVWAWLCGWS